MFTKVIGTVLLNALLYFSLSVWWLFIFVSVNIKEKLSRSNLNILLITFQGKKGRTLSLNTICYNYSEWAVTGAVRQWLRLTDGWHQLHALIVSAASSLPTVTIWRHTLSHLLCCKVAHDRVRMNAAALRCSFPSFPAQPFQLSPTPLCRHGRQALCCWVSEWGFVFILEKSLD